jgi:4-amino-4-deoxy-L-arabinose transferase-like glycosyltransferase
LIAYSFLGADGALIAGLTLAGSYQYIEEGRIGRVDMTLCFCEAIALFAFLYWYAPPPRPSPAAGPAPSDRRGPGFLRYIFAFALGLGVLAKGPVGAILPALAIAIFLIAKRRMQDLWRLATPGPLILGAATASCWYIACYFDHRYSFLNRQLGSENFGRFFGTLGAMAPWYYAKPLFFNSFPMSCLLPLAAYAALRARRDDSPPVPPPDAASAIASSRPSQNPLSIWSAARMMFLPPMDPAQSPAERATAARASAAARLAAIFYISTIVFFTIAAYKRRAYLLPLWPPGALLLGWWLARLARTYAVGRAVRNCFAAACIILIVFNFFWMPYKEIRGCGGDSFREAAAEINRIVGPAEPLYFYDMPAEPASILFYLNRDAPVITGKLGDAPPGYVIIPAAKWAQLKDQALTLEPVYESTSGAYQIVLLHPGKTYASTTPR